MNVLAALFAILAILTGLLAFFGADVGGDMGILAIVFLGATLLCMCLPAVNWPRRT